MTELYFLAALCLTLILAAALLIAFIVVLKIVVCLPQSPIERRDRKFSLTIGESISPQSSAHHDRPKPLPRKGHRRPRVRNNPRH